MDSEFITWSHKFVQGITVEAGAAGNTDLEGTAVDTGNYQSVAIVVSFGPIVSGAEVYIKAQQSADSGFSSPQDITGTKQVVADTQSNEVFIIDIIRRDYENYPWLRVHVDRATQASTCAVLYILYDIRVTPATQPTGINVEQWKNVTVGTA
jgi:hypothetical protein